MTSTPNLKILNKIKFAKKIFNKKLRAIIEKFFEALIVYDVCKWILRGKYITFALFKWVLTYPKYFAQSPYYLFNENFLEFLIFLRYVYGPLSSHLCEFNVATRYGFTFSFLWTFMTIALLRFMYRKFWRNIGSVNDELFAMFFKGTLSG